MGPSHGAEAHQRGTSPGIWVRASQLGSVGNRKGEQKEGLFPEGLEAVRGQAETSD